MLQASSRNNTHMLSTPRSASSSSRTTRVMEELQDNLETIQKELENTKIQLLTVKENKEQSEKENEEFIESNKQLRADIQEIMQILESKQQLLDSTKKTSMGTENQVKQLKDEAMAARKELDDLKRREHTIEKECRTIELLKEKQLQNKKTLEQSVAQSQAEFAKEIGALEMELASVQDQIQALKQKDVAAEAKQMVEKQAKERQALIQHYKQIQEQIESNHQQFVDLVKQELKELMEQVTEETGLDTQVNHCKEDVDSLIARIKSNAAVSITE
ncbi:uncharacterized protein B0P05DRAFT_553193 [Gilbertella persicaria]|uniref:uncharacterized protein n=1 Tax=Gilbertella persicaria TaxID=101096 RepID=UPI00221E97B6|nr:uncharacterized protein B0P05DRAFT_553193 [Gilbertella persicaria]KAI8067006.1 hypothetical protein B0P05DRAFT_553193 [Gilbertella persicaria]